MLDTAKDYLKRETFSVLVYVCSIVHFLCGVVLTGIVVALKEEEAGRFSCYVAPGSTLIYKAQIDKTCYSRYRQNYNSPLPFYWFVILSIWFPIIVAVIYSLGVRRRVEEIHSSNERHTSEAENQVPNRTSFVLFSYVIQLAIRVLSGILFTILQYAVFYSSGFDVKFSCSLPPTVFTTKIPKNTSASQYNFTTIDCENATASDKHISWIIVTVFNASFALMMFLEIIRLCRQFSSCDADFVRHFLRKPYQSVDAEQTELRERQISEPGRPIDVVPPRRTNVQEDIDFYKEQVLKTPRSTDVNFGPKAAIDDDLHVDVIIYTGQAPHKFSKDMKRHEMFHVYMEVPEDSIRLEKAQDLFYPAKDTNNKRPRKILAIGRPGIGKTVMTERVVRDWANRVDKFYRTRGKIVFYFKFRWFGSKELQHITLEAFLRYGTGLNEERFRRIFQYISKHTEKVILIFDGLDEFLGGVDCLDQLPPLNDPNVPMSGISLFCKLIFGLLLPKATVLVTSRPTAHDFYSRLKFDRTVEILGFTLHKTKEYVRKFCDNKSRPNLQEKIWNHVRSSSDLLHLCYIPVNCWIVSTILFECVKDPTNDTNALPTTLTELYQLATKHFDRYHNRKFAGLSSEEATKKLELLAYNGIGPRQLVFDEETFDEESVIEMKNSGLLNELWSPSKTQYCFIHLTIQEFLAARHVTKTFTPDEIKEFILSHIESGKWHLVLQFIAGLLGKRNGYKDCVLAFAHSFVCADGWVEIENDCSELFIMRCLKEADDENVVKEACDVTSMKGVVSLSNKYAKLNSTDWAAVIFLCKHMKKLTTLDLHLADPNKGCNLEVNKLLLHRCVRQLKLEGPFYPLVEAGCLFRTLVESNCSLKHEHVKLTELEIDYFQITDEESLSMMCEFFKNGHGSCLEKLSLRHCGMSSREVSMLCEVLDNKLCPKLTCLGLSVNDERVTVLCKSLIEHKVFTLNKLDLHNCLLTDDCIASLCDLLTDKRCNLTVLSLERNEGISDKGLRMLCRSALTTEDCKLVELSMSRCSLTDDCMPDLREALQDEHCKLTSLELNYCSLTDQCISVLCKALQDERCKLTALSLRWNKGIRDKGVRMLCRSALTMEHCKLRKLDLLGCSFTDKCLSDLREALQNEHCVLNELNLVGAKFTEKGRECVREIANGEYCKARCLKIIVF